MQLYALPHRSRTVRRIAIIATFLSCLMAPKGWAQFTGVFTYHNDMGRTGWNPNETILTPSNVNMSNFGKVFAYPVDGAIFAQPLYVPNVTIPGQGSRNVVYVVTENDGVYAFDADGRTSTPLWYVSLVNPAQGITAVPCALMASSCNVFPIDGITGTPVIDPVTQTIYFVAQTAENGSYFQRLHALDITTGAEKFGGPTVIQGSVHNSKGTLVFDTLHNLPRPGLLLLNNVIYIAWAGSTHGWMMAYDATTLQQIAIICSTPNGNLGGLWASGGGIMSDGTDVFVEAGDGTFDLNAGGKDFGDAIVKLDPNTLTVLDYFAPKDQLCRKTNDMDLGSGGPMLLTNQPGAHPSEIIVSGKGGNPCEGPNGPAPVYVVDKNNLGGYSSTVDLDIETINGAAYGYHSNPAYFQGSTGSWIYLAGLISEGGAGEPLKQYTLTNGLPSVDPTAQSNNIFVIGATPSVSSNGAGNGILWAQARADILSATANIKPSVLYAYDATNVATELYDSSQAGSRDQAGAATKFVTPMIANGRVYLPTLAELDVYGLLAGQSATSTVLSTGTNYYGSPVTLTATVTSTGGTPQGSANFYLKDGYNLAGVASLSSGKGSIQINGLSVGSHTYNGTYNGTGNFAVSVAAPLTFSVNKAPTTTVINSSSLNPSTYGQPVTFTATVTSNNPGAGVPTGTITFQKGGAVLGSGTVSGSGVATYTTMPTQLTGGADKITATYNPDTNHAKSVSPVFTQTVNVEATSTAFTSSPNPSTVGQLVTLTATVTAAVGTPTGSVVFKNGTTTLGTVALSNGVAKLSYRFPTQGSFSLKAAYQGSVNNSPSSNTLTQTVN